MVISYVIMAMAIREIWVQCQTSLSYIIVIVLPSVSTHHIFLVLKLLKLYYQSSLIIEND